MFRELLKKLWKKTPLFLVLAVSALVVSLWGDIGGLLGYRSYERSVLKEPGLKLVLQGVHDGVMPWQAFSPSAAKKESASGAWKEEKQQQTSGGEATTQQSGKDSTADAAAEAAAKAATAPMPAGVCSEVVQAKDYGVAEATYLTPEGVTFKPDTSGLFAKNGTFYQLQKVDQSYFKDALFIGDSRTVGLRDYGGMNTWTSFAAKESTGVYNIQQKKLDYSSPESGGQTTEATLDEVLSAHQYRKVYISLGINELGVGNTQQYCENMRAMVQHVLQSQPDAIIYLQAIMHVTQRYSSTDKVFNNRLIVDRNSAIATLANGRNIFYLDMNAEVCDGDGNLKAELTGDGIHLKASGYEYWKNFLLNNAIVRDQNDWSGSAGTASSASAADTAAAAKTAQ